MSFPATNFAADFRALLGDAKVRLPLKASETKPGYIVDAEGKTVMGLNLNALDVDAQGAIKLARTVAGAINWQAGVEVKG